ncbi:SDR family NAD(P)-dependent oxidoreductase [Altererythrobacter sp. MF3-039]|uniref:SDR family NAD(P)-dependent oxidoreductase n=1 Tax=Altererythrobacter sp. MF3-039 TaxID=3252901 RepID=UPI00390C90C6
MSTLSKPINWPNSAVVFGASGGIGASFCEHLVREGTALVYAGSRGELAHKHPSIRHFSFDLAEETTIARSAEMLANDPPSLVIVSTGVLTHDNGVGPEKSFKQIDQDAMLQSFRLNTVGPALIAKHVLPILPRDRRAVFAVLSARVGSIRDNRLGGWHSYRASKAALNMLVRTFAIEMRRTHPETIISGLHPGTVDTGLSRPFQSNLADGQLTEPSEAAANLLSVIASLTSENSGYVFDWKGDRIPD